jgi:cytochrome c-type biogenesis protein CcmH
VNRRGFLALLGAPGVAALAAAPQDTSGGAADPLARPDWAGRPRAEVRVMDNDPIVKVIERRLRCTCGCGLDIYTCRTTDFTCTYSPELHREVIELLEAGSTPDEVVEAFVAKHGETVLMAPRAQGFGAVGYLLPGAAVLTAGSLLAWVLVRRGRAAPVPEAGPAGPDPAPDASAEELARVDAAVRELDR